MAITNDGTALVSTGGINANPAPMAGVSLPLIKPATTPASTSVPNVGASLPSPTSTTSTAKPASALSSVAGQTALTNSVNTATKLSAPPVNQPGASPVYDDQNNITGYNVTGADGTTTFKANPAPTSTANPNTTTLVNPTTGAEYTLTDPTADQIANFKAQGWDVAEGTGSGAGVVQDNTDPQVAAAQNATAQAKSDLAAATAKLSSFDVSNDPALTSILSSITADWNQREADMQKVNDSRTASTTTLGIRLGDRYTGGTGGMFGSIISEEERQGVDRISQLESQKQQALASATTAYQNQKWDQYSKLVDIAQKSYDDQVSQLKDLQTASAAQSKALADAATKAQEDFYTQVTKPIQDVALEASKNGLTDPKTLAAIQNAPDLGTAISLAGDSLQSGTGIVGEYLFYKNQAKNAGQTPVDFNTYQNIDANRKAKATAAANGVTGTVDLSTFDKATQSKLKSSGFTGYSGGVQNLALQLVTGQLAPSELSKRTTGTASYNDVLTAADTYSVATTGQHFNIAQADRNYKFSQNPATQNTLNYLGSLVGSDDGTGNITGGNLDDLVSLSNDITRTTFPAVNDIAAWARYSVGDPKIAAFQATATEVADQVAKILQGGNGGGGTSDAKLQQAANLFNTSFTKDQLVATVNALKPLLANRAKSMIKDNPYLSDYADQFGVDQSMPGTQPSTAKTIQAQETIAQSALKSYAATNSGSQVTITNQIKTMEKTLGRPVTATEFLQAFPEYAP